MKKLYLTRTAPNPRKALILLASKGIDVDDMDDLDVQLLGTVGEVAARRADAHVGQAFQQRAGLAGQGDDLDAQGLGCLGGLDHVGALAAGTDGQQHIACATVGFHVTREDVVITEVVGHAADMAGVADRHRGDARAVLAITPGQLLGEMHGVAH